LIGHTALGKMLWELFFPFFQLTRPARLQSIKMWSWWNTANVAAGLLFDAAILFLCGPNGLLYLLGSFFFAIGFHPLGARWVQDHYTLDSEQETYSYYGPLNFLALNVGYHNEHHDFPSIPWNRLPNLKALAPEFYDNLNLTGPGPGFGCSSLFDRRFTLFRRVERVGAGKVVGGKPAENDTMGMAVSERNSSIRDGRLGIRALMNTNSKALLAGSKSPPMACLLASGCATNKIAYPDCSPLAR
jgi:sphingolipid delta-4 desaturase